MPLPAQHVECLLVALLAVNNYSLEKVWKLLPRLRELGVTDPACVATMDMPAAIEALSAAGYDRKNLTWMFAERTRALMQAIHADKLDALAAAIETRNQRVAAELLQKVRGVGPRVVENAWVLLTAEEG